MMSADEIQNGWIILGVGVVSLFLAALQLWTGRVFLGFGWPLHPSPWFYRKKEPFEFWFQVGLLVAVGLLAVGLAAARLL
jgi:hypothetical protein